MERNDTYEEMYARLHKLARQYPQFIHLESIGISHDNREILALTMGNPRKVLFCTAGIHGRETINPVILIQIMEEYAHAYQIDLPVPGHPYSIRELLWEYGICFVPLVNPDGYEIASRGFGQIQNLRLRQNLRIQNIPSREWKGNARGVDINRNFPCRSYHPRNPGDSPASENETAALIHLFQIYDSVGYVDFHSRGKIIYYYRHAMSGTYNSYSQRLAKYLQDLSHYEIAKMEDEFLTLYSGGNSVNYYSEVPKKPALTVETVEESASFPLQAKYYQETYKEIQYIPLGILAQIIADAEETL